jgi:hypothetical protein
MNSGNEPVLAQLVAQAESEGASRLTLRALVEEACAAGAARALAAAAARPARRSGRRRT